MKREVIGGEERGKEEREGEQENREKRRGGERSGEGRGREEETLPGFNLPLEPSRLHKGQSQLSRKLGNTAEQGMQEK